VRLPSGATCAVRGDSLGVRAIAQRMLGGPDELAAPRPLGDVETSLWSLVVATALEDLGVAGHVWPSATPSDVSAHVGVELAVTLGAVRLAVSLQGSAELLVRAAAGGGPGAAWLDRVVFDAPIVAGRCALHRDDLARIAVRSVVTLERPASGAAFDLDLAIVGGAVGLRPGGEGLPMVVATGYGSRDMSLPDEAHVELTVAIGTTQLTLRQITGLAVGSVVPLHRGLGGPFELRAGGRVLGRGELVDVRGELAVRIVSLGD